MRLVTMVPFRVAPPHSGGRRLVHGAARWYAAHTEAYRCVALTTLRDHPPPPPTPFACEEYRVGASALLALERARLLPKIPYLRALGRRARGLARAAMRSRPDVVEVHFPWLAPVRRGLPPEVRCVLILQNVETDWYAPHVAQRPLSRLFGRMLWRMEREALALADHVVCLTTQDRDKIAARHPSTADRLTVIPPGATPLPPPEPDPAAAHRLLVVGSGFGDSVPSIQRLVETVAPRLAPPTTLIVAGAVCRRLDARRLPPRVRLAGEVDDLGALTRSCRALLNPDTAETGINMKVIDALAAGVPVVSSAEGARGYGDLVGHGIRVGSLESFPDLARTIEPLSASDREAIGRYDWRVIGPRRLALYASLRTPGAGGAAPRGPAQSTPS